MNRNFLAATIIVCGLSGSGAQHVNAGHTDLTDFSLEELSSVGLENPPKSVTANTAARVTQTTADAPSVVHIVTAENIQMYGYRTLDAILRSLPGLYTTSDGVNTYLGVRGFGRPGDYNTRILILIDGVRLNDNIFDSALVGREFPLDVDLIERIEYAPGPGSAVYGNNAFFGVVNVITRTGHSLDGVEVSAGYGSLRDRSVRLSYGTRLDSGVDLLLSFTDFDSKGAKEPYYWDWGDAEPGKEKPEIDFTENRTLFGKVSFGSFHFETLYGRRLQGIPIADDTTIYDDHSEAFDERVFIDASYEKWFGTDWALAVRANYHEAGYTGSFPFLDEYGNRVIEVEDYPGSWVNGEIRLTNTSLNNHRILLGIEVHQDIDAETTFGLAGNEPDFAISDRYHSYGVYLQDDIAITDSAMLLAGIRFDYTERGNRVNPRLGIIWHPQEESTLKVLYGSAFRTANYFEIGNNLDREGISLPGLESINTLEAAFEHFFNSTTRLSGSLYHYQLANIIEETLDPDTMSFFFENSSTIQATGFEFEVERRFSEGAQLNLNYTVQQTDNGDGERLSNSPAHLVKLRGSLPLWSENWKLAGEVQFISHRTNEQGDKIDQYLLGNATITGKLARDFDLSASLYNIANVTYSDPVRFNVGPDVEQDGRSFFLKVDFHY